MSIAINKAVTWLYVTQFADTNTNVISPRGKGPKIASKATSELEFEMSTILEHKSS